MRFFVIKRAGAGILACWGILAWSIAPAFASTSYPNDYFFAAGKQWALSGAPASINAPAAWCVSTGAGVTIGHIDTGADFSHPDLHGKLIPGAAFVGGDGSMTGQGQDAAQDDNGHGTSTAGILMAKTDNRVGVAGVAPGARALVVKVLNQDGTGHSIDIAAGVRWAVDHGVQVINLSIGFDKPLFGEAPDNIPKAIAYAAERGVAVAVASGGDPLPFTAEQVNQIANQALVVGALTSDGAVASYSKDPRGVNIYAPGGGFQPDDSQHYVVSTHWSKEASGGYVFAQGASVASPHAAGVLALLAAKGYTAPQARERILTTAPSPKGVPQLDAAKALGAGNLCGARAAAPVAAAGRPRVAPYQPPAKSVIPDASGATAAAPPIVASDGPVEGPPPHEQEAQTARLPLGPWPWLVAIAVLTGLVWWRATAYR